MKVRVQQIQFTNCIIISDFQSRTATYVKEYTYYSPLFPRILEVNMSHILRPTGQKLGMSHLLLPLGYHSVQSKLISCTVHLYRSMIYHCTYIIIIILIILYAIKPWPDPQSKQTRILSQREDY